MQFFSRLLEPYGVPFLILIDCVWIFFFLPYSDDDYKDDDIIFEDFARLRLKGETEA